MNMERLEQFPYFLDVFTDRVNHIPDEVMLVDDSSGMTARDADELSGRVYAWLADKGIGKEDFVMILLPRSIYAVVAMIGVWKAGAALTVVEHHYSKERIDYIRKDCNCKAVIDTDSWDEIRKKEPLEGYRMPDPHDAAIAVYTSGSTGNPKGVLHEYGNIKLQELSMWFEEGPKLDRESLKIRSAGS